MEPLRSGLDDAGENQKSRQDEGNARDADQLRVFAKLADGSRAPVAFAAPLYQPPFGAKLCRFAVRRRDRGKEYLAAAFDKGCNVYRRLTAGYPRRAPARESFEERSGWRGSALAPYGNPLTQR